MGGVNFPTLVFCSIVILVEMKLYFNAIHIYISLMTNGVNHLLSAVDHSSEKYLFSSFALLVFVQVGTPGKGQGLLLETLWKSFQPFLCPFKNRAVNH